MKKTLFILAIALCGAGMLSAQGMKGFVSAGETTPTSSATADVSFGMPVAGVVSNDNYTVTVEKPFSHLQRVEFEDQTVWGGTNLDVTAEEGPYYHYFEFHPVLYPKNNGLNQKYMPLKEPRNLDVLAQINLTVRPCGPGVEADYGDGRNSYESVPVANHCWTKKNLKETEEAPNSRVYGDNTDDNFIDTYGRLYTWSEAAQDAEINDYGYMQGICPEGWHIPTVQERADLDALPVADINDETSWQGTHETYTNVTGFTAMPAGIYNAALDRYESFGTQTDWWTDNNGNTSASEISVIEISYYCTNAMNKTQNANNAISVRCVKDEVEE